MREVGARVGAAQVAVRRKKINKFRAYIEIATFLRTTRPRQFMRTTIQGSEMLTEQCLSHRSAFFLICSAVEDAGAPDLVWRIRAGLAGHRQPPCLRLSTRHS